MKVKFAFKKMAALTAVIILTMVMSSAVFAADDVSKNNLLVGFQTTDIVDGKYKVRFISEIPSLAYKEVGFVVTNVASGGVARSSTDTVYKELYQTNADGSVTPITFTKTQEDAYYKSIVIRGLSASSTYNLQIQAFYVTNDGELIYSDSALLSLGENATRKGAYKGNLYMTFEDGDNSAESDYATVTLNVGNYKNISGLELALDYDESALEFEAGTAAEVLSNNGETIGTLVSSGYGTFDQDQHTLVWANSSGLVDANDSFSGLISLRFKVLEGAENGKSYTVKAIPVDVIRTTEADGTVTNANIDNINKVGSVSGKISISK